MYETGINGKLFARITASADGRQISLSYLNIRHPVFKISLGQTDLFSDVEPIWFESLVIDCIKADYHNDESLAGIGLAQQTSVLPQWGQRIELDDGIWNEDGVDTQKENLVDRNILLSTLSMLTVGPGQRLKEQLSRFIYLCPLREVPERNYEPLRSPDESRWAHGLAAWDVRYNSNARFVHLNKRLLRCFAPTDLQLDPGFH